MRRGLASLIMGLSLLIATASWAGFVMSRTVLDPGSVRTARRRLARRPRDPSDAGRSAGRLGGGPDTHRCAGHPRRRGGSRRQCPRRSPGGSADPRRPGPGPSKRPQRGRRAGHAGRSRARRRRARRRRRSAARSRSVPSARSGAPGGAAEHGSVVAGNGETLRRPVHAHRCDRGHRRCVDGVRPRPQPGRSVAPAGVLGDRGIGVLGRGGLRAAVGAGTDRAVIGLDRVGCHRRVLRGDDPPRGDVGRDRRRAPAAQLLLAGARAPPAGGPARPCERAVPPRPMAGGAWCRRRHQPLTATRTPGGRRSPRARPGRWESRPAPYEARAGYPERWAPGQGGPGGSAVAPQSEIDSTQQFPQIWSNVDREPERRQSGDGPRPYRRRIRRSHPVRRLETTPPAAGRERPPTSAAPPNRRTVRFPRHHRPRSVAQRRHTATRVPTAPHHPPIPRRRPGSLGLHPQLHRWPRPTNRLPPPRWSGQSPVPARPGRPGRSDPAASRRCLRRLPRRPPCRRGTTSTRRRLHPCPCLRSTSMPTLLPTSTISGPSGWRARATSIATRDADRGRCDPTGRRRSLRRRARPPAHRGRRTARSR